MTAGVLVLLDNVSEVNQEPGAEVEMEKESAAGEILWRKRDASHAGTATPLLSLRLKIQETGKLMLRCQTAEEIHREIRTQRRPKRLVLDHLVFSSCLCLHALALMYYYPY